MSIRRLLNPVVPRVIRASLIQERVPVSELSSHFEFGRNWSSYAGLIDDERVAEAVRGLERLAGPGGIAGKTFLDIGCGSGLHSLAALRLGASRVLSVDLDPHSVATSRQVLGQYTSET